MTLADAAAQLNRDVQRLKFGAPVTHIYNPLDYAAAGHAAYLKKYGSAPKEVVFLGMNPGPWGMAQTGVPFGDVTMVRDFLQIDVSINKPTREHPKRPVQGFACTRSEVSGTRLWGAMRDWCDTPQTFFARFFVANYCPLSFMEASGLNRTPDKLPASERDALFAVCDEHLRQVVAYLKPTWVIGVGAFAETRANIALQKLPVQVGRIPHPSPASPTANRDWAGATKTALNALGINV